MYAIVAFVAVLLTALNLGMSWCHVLQIAGKAPWPGPLWATAMQSLYMQFAGVGAAVQVASIVAAWALVPFASGRSRWWVVAAAFLLSLDMAMWFAFIAPINAVMATWAPSVAPPDLAGYLAHFERTLPPDWSRWRDAWEGWHSVGAVLDALAMSALTVALLRRSSPAGYAASQRR